MFVGKIEARAYSRATEIADRVRSAIYNLFPEDVKSALKTTTTQAEGHSGDRILVINSTLERKKMCDRVLTHIIDALTDAERQIIETSLDDRLDDQCTLFLRIDKQAAFLEQLRLTNEPDVILLRIHLRDYPRCQREDARDMILDRLRSAGGRSL
jgi:hypothetical protein